MTVYAGLDVSLNETSIDVCCDAEGVVVQECRVPSEPDAIDQAFRAHVEHLGRVGVEASSLGAWLQTELACRGFEAIVIESRHTHVSLSTMAHLTRACADLRVEHGATHEPPGHNTLPGQPDRRFKPMAKAPATTWVPCAEAERAVVYRARIS